MCSYTNPKLKNIDTNGNQIKGHIYLLRDEKEDVWINLCLHKSKAEYSQLMDFSLTRDFIFCKPKKK